MKIIAVIALTLQALVSTVAWADDLAPFAGLAGTIDVAGGTAHIPVVQAAAKRIGEFNPKVRITVAGGGSGVGVQKVGEGLVQIGSTGRDVTAQEIAKYGLKTFAFAIDGVAVVVHPSNGVSALTSEQVKAIYTGKIGNWKDVGGADQRINLITRDEASGTREVFNSLVLKGEPQAEQASVVPSNGAVKAAISRDARAIGFVGIGYIDGTVKALALDGQFPTQEAARNGSYRLTRNLYFNTKGEPSALVARFLDYIFSPSGAGIVAQSGYIPIPAKP